MHLNPEKFIVVLNDKRDVPYPRNIGFLTNWRKRLITHPEFEAMIGRMKDPLEEDAQGAT